MGFGVALTPAETITYRAPVTGGLTEHERVQIFYGLADRTQLALTPDPDEVMDTRWISRTALDAEIAPHPHQFAPWLRIYMKRWDEICLPQSAATDSASRAAAHSRTGKPNSDDSGAADSTIEPSPNSDERPSEPLTKVGMPSMDESNAGAFSSTTEEAVSGHGAR